MHQNLNVLIIFLAKLISLTTLSIIIFVIGYRFRYKRFYSLIDKIPGPHTLPIIGNLHRCPLFRPNDVAKYFLHLGDTYGSPSKLKLSEFPIILINKPEHAQIVLNTFAYRGDMLRNLVSPLVGDSLIVTKNLKKWHNRRKTATKSLTPAVLETFMPIFIEFAEVIKKKLKCEIGNKKPFDVWDYISQINFEIVLRTSMGLTIDLREKKQIFLDGLEGQLSIFSTRMSKVWLLIDFLFKITPYYRKQQSNVKNIFEIINAVIEEKIRDKAKKIETKDHYVNSNEEKQIPEINPQKKGFLDLLIDVIENDPTWTSKDLLDEVNLFFAGSYHTSVTTMCFLLLNFGFHQDAQEKAFQELIDIFGYSDRECTSEDLPKMTYLDKCIRESLRMYPSLPYDIRYSNQNIELDGYMIPKGVNILLNYISMFRNKNIWENPEVFDPERFSPENVKNRHSYAYLPFGGGIRPCLGKRYAMMSIKTIISNILRKYKISTPLKENDLVLVFGMVLKPVQGFQINIEERILKVM